MQEIQGFVDTIVYQNDENGYAIARIKDRDEATTIVGYIPYLSEGQNLRLFGDWIVHPTFGKQFKVQSFEEILPDSVKGIERYLASGVVTGIGPVTAKKIVDRFGEDTLEILDKDIARLKEIEGIGNKKIQVISESFSKQHEIRNIMMFLQNYGISPNQCGKIYKRFGSDSIRVVRENPYALTEEVSGIGFKTADKIAKSLGIDENSAFRIESGIKYVVNQFCALGNTYMPREKLVKNCLDTLGVTQQEIEEGIYSCALEGKIKVENVEEKSCVYTLPYYNCELGVTKKIIEITLNEYVDVDIDVDSEIKTFETRLGVSFAASQKEAIKAAFCNGVEIITGGSGTGKTTIINCIAEIFDKADMKILLGAPTGRAAKRMAEATGREAKTIHRLLEMGVGDNEDDMMFSKGENTPLDCDVLIVDEASMIDIMLMNNLLKAVPQGMRLIIVGDVDQLPSVGPGNVLRDFIESGWLKVIRLKEIFRQAKESMIIVNAHRINAGEMPVINARENDFYFIKEDDQGKILSTLMDLLSKRLPSFNKNWDPNKNIQILSPMRKGILGISNLNTTIQEMLNPPAAGKQEKESKDTVFRVGDKVMQTKNNYQLKWTRVSGEGEDEGVGIFNGDMGYIDDIDDDDNTITVIFDEERKVVYESMYIEEIDLAYAITIHKSQGSEFPVVIIPMFPGPPMLMNRNLLYTGITRAKQMVVLVGSPKSLSSMVSNNRSFERYSMLKWRIMDIVQHGLEKNM
ncbi:MAG TPA: ATP-dependent RecD-like DNA helicase [Clostridiaceae bacterium]|nr:ATP-dependent RecD-like DNA helicase [Clostridiaceae bacterium]